MFKLKPAGNLKIYFILDYMLVIDDICFPAISFMPPGVNLPFYIFGDTFMR